MVFLDDYTFEPISKNYCFEYAVPEILELEPDTRLSVRVTMQWSGSTIEAVRRIQNTHNSIAVEYKVQLEVDGELYQSRCDVFPVYNTQFNLTTDSGYPFYCSCTKKGCQSKQCTFETNPSHQGLDYGNWCNANDNGLEEVAISPNMKKLDFYETVKATQLLFDKTSYGRWLGVSGLNLMTFHNAPIETNGFEVVVDENTKIGENLNWVDSANYYKGIREIKPLREQTSLYFISDAVSEQVFKEFIQLATGDGKFNNLIVPKSDDCVGQNSGGYNYNTWNVPKSVYDPERKVSIQFTAHGLPQHSGGCTSHYKYTTDQILAIDENIEHCVVVIGMGNQFNTQNAAFFLERLLKIEMVSRERKNCDFVFMSQPYTNDGKRWPMYGYSWHALRQLKIAKHVFGANDQWTVVDTFGSSSYASWKFGGFGQTKIPVKLANIMAQQVMEAINQQNIKNEMLLQ